MRMAAVTAGVMALAVSAGPVLAADGPAGTWRMTNGKVTVRLVQCGGGLCGRIVGLKKPLDDEGHVKLDRKNPNPALRKRPVVGLTILSNMRAAGDGYWSGTIYNPDDGNTYSSRLQLISSGTMKVSGCVAGVLCKTMKFVRID